MSLPTTSWLLWQNEHLKTSSDPDRFTHFLLHRLHSSPAVGGGNRTHRFRYHYHLNTGPWQSANNGTAQPGGPQPPYGHARTGNPVFLRSVFGERCARWYRLFQPEAGQQRTVPAAAWRYVRFPGPPLREWDRYAPAPRCGIAAVKL